MNFFSIRTNDHNTIKKILDGDKKIVFNTLSGYQTFVCLNDIIFIVISGDESKKQLSYQNGLRAIGKIIQLPSGESDGKHFSLEVEISDFLPKVLTKDDFYVYPILKDAPSIGPDTKSAANQAFRKIEPVVGKAVFSAIKDLLGSEFDISKYATLIGNDYSINKLQDNKQVENSYATNSFVQDSFVKWFNDPKNFLKSYDGLVTRKVLNFWNENYFDNHLFNIDPKNPQESLSNIEKLISAKTNKENHEWKSFSYATNRGAPEAVLGKKNYLKFLSEFIIDKENLGKLLESSLPVAKSVSISIENFSYKAFHTKLREANLQFTEELVARFTSSLLTKPFVILTGLSGSGKTKLAQAYATWICADKDQYCIIPVGADWTNREPLLGFPNALDPSNYIWPQNEALNLIIQASEDKNKPYFLILDEMNLSHVERYFADFLSAMESKSWIDLHSSNEIKSVPKRINLPSNLFIIGTVNIDETTYMFSPKVLDRANVIEFRVLAKEMEMFLETAGDVDMKVLEANGASMALGFISIASNKSLTLTDQDTITKSLVEFFTELKKTGSEFGYRSSTEILRFASVLQELDNSWSTNKIIDVAIMQKLLPKVHGSRKKLAPVLESLGSLCLTNPNQISEVFDAKTENDYINIANFPISLEKITRMYRNLMDNGFTSYAEA